MGIVRRNETYGDWSIDYLNESVTDGLREWTCLWDIDETCVLYLDISFSRIKYIQCKYCGWTASDFDVARREDTIDIDIDIDIDIET